MCSCSLPDCWMIILLQSVVLFKLLLTDMRLVGNAASGEGRLEVYHDAKWGTVCDDYFGQSNAEVACYHLGYGLVLQDA
jgi:Scavenger receptor cysteine-rich domain